MIVGLAEAILMARIYYSFFHGFQCTDDQKVNGTCRLWTALDLFIFIVMGFVGGLLGALFNQLNKWLTIYRMKHVNTKPKYVRYAFGH